MVYFCVRHIVLKSLKYMKSTKKKTAIFIFTVFGLVVFICSIPIVPRDKDQFEGISLVKGVETEKKDSDTKDVAVSMQGDSYASGLLSFGEGTPSSYDMGSNDPLSAVNIKSRILEEEDGSVVAVISWDTSLPARGKITIVNGEGGISRAVDEKAYDVSHSIFIEGLSFRTSYTFTILNEGQYGDSVISGRYGFFVPSKKESVFELIASSFADIFSTR